MTYRYAGKKLSGICDLRGLLDGKSVVVLGSGPTLEDFLELNVPEEWPILAINEAVAYGGRVDYWCLSDEPIVLEYASRCPRSATVLAMHQATLTVEEALQDMEVYTVNSMPHVKEYDNGFEFFSRGTVMIGGIEMMRYMGAKRFFCFGLDCYRERDRYYYDGRKPGPASENKTLQIDLVHKAKKLIWCTPKLRRMVKKLREARAIWDGKIEVYCVNSPDSQSGVQKLTMSEFVDKTKERKKKRGKRSSSRLAEVKSSSSESIKDPEGDGDEGGSSSSSVGTRGGGSEVSDLQRSEAGTVRVGDPSRGDDEGDL